MDDYKKYLAEHILSEDKVITYRFLSRALKVHVNIAKQMLYDFHKSHNAKHPGAVHATYLLYGSKHPGEGRSQAQVGDDGDIEMASSMPENETGAEIVPTLTLSLVPEEQLKDVAAMYDEITSVHVYSLGPHPMKDAALLSDAAHELFTLPVATDSSGAPHAYGAISNPRARRRDRRGPAANLTASPSQRPVAKVAAKPPPKVKEEPKVNQQTDTKATKVTAAPSMAGFLQKKSVPSLKRGGSSGIMESFAKGAAAAAKAKAKKAETSQPATPSGDDSSMHPMSEGEEDDSKVLPLPKAHEGAGRMSRKDNEEALRRMMDNDDDDEEEEPEEDEPEEQEPSEAEEAAEDSPAPEPKNEEPAEIVSTSGGGRRRGRRKIMKKKQTLDDQGYLVTIQEPGWESFSEDEAPPPPPISKPKPTSSAPTAKPKKAAPKTGQGNIMSFFSKK